MRSPCSDPAFFQAPHAHKQQVVVPIQCAELGGRFCKAPARARCSWCSGSAPICVHRCDHELRAARARRVPAGRHGGRSHGHFWPAPGALPRRAGECSCRCSSGATGLGRASARFGRRGAVSTGLLWPLQRPFSSILLTGEATAVLAGRRRAHGSAKLAPPLPRRQPPLCSAHVCSLPPPTCRRSKRQLLLHLQATRQCLQRLHVCAQWAHKAKAVNTCREVLKAAQDHGAAFVHTGGCWLLGIASWKGGRAGP